VAIHLDRFCFDRARSKWFKWNDHYWIIDTLGTVIEALVDVINIYQREADRQLILGVKSTRDGSEKQAETHNKNASALQARVKALRGKQRKQHIIWRVEHGENSLAIAGDEWDSDPWLLACQNGVINLRDGSFRPGLPADLIKTAAPVEWRGIDCPCPNFEKFIAEILVTDTYEPDLEMVSFLQRLLGYGLIGQVIEHIFPILWGPRGRNGKDTLCSVLREVLGDYVAAIQVETLLQSKYVGSGGGARSDLVTLQSKRIVWASETERWHRLSPAKVKFLSGGGTIRARAPYASDEIEFSPRHLILFLTNPKPMIMAGPADPIWERILLIPFHLSFVANPQQPWEREADIWLLDRLKEEKSGILAWLVRGAMAWSRDRLHQPCRVRSATAEYRDEENVLGDFLDEATEESNGDRIKARDLYLTYVKWCERGRSRPMLEREFGQDMADKITKVKTKTGNFYLHKRLSAMGEELLAPCQGEQR